jgi:putative ABC transport system permease protein
VRKPHLFSLWRNLRHRSRVERDLDDEMQAFLDLTIHEKTAAGMSPADARRAALVDLGGVESAKEQVRHARAGWFVESLIQDLSYAARVLRRTPFFSLTAALSLAIGVGATTAIFTVANGLLLRAAVGVSDPDRLVDIVPFEAGLRPGIVMASYTHYEAIRDRATTLAGTYAYRLEPTPFLLKTDGGVEPIFGGVVSPTYFQVLGVPAAAGRLFTPADGGVAGEGQVVVLSHEFWSRQFHADPRVVGTTVLLGGRAFTIIGVGGEGFHGTSVTKPDLWLPLSVPGIHSSGAGPAPTPGAFTPSLMIGGRLKPGIARAQASAEIESISRALEPERRSGAPMPASVPGSRDRSASALRWTVESSSPIPFSLRLLVGGFLALLMGVVSVVLVIACANVSGVLLARAAARRREIAVRRALGAGRRRIVRQLLTETVLLFVIGGAAGLALARLLTSVLVSLLPAFPIPIHVSVPIDARVAAFSLGLSFIAALLSGLAPARHASKTDVLSALKDDAQRPHERLRLRHAFVVAQVAFSIALVVTAGLLVRTVGRVGTIDRGFESQGVVTASLDLSLAGYDAAASARFTRTLLERLRAIGGVDVATAADRSPGGPMRMNRGGLRATGSAPLDELPVLPNWHVIESDYFKTLRIPVVQGRDFTPADRDGAEPVAIVSEATARRLWPGRSALGQHLVWQSQPGTGAVARPSDPRGFLVVGIVKDLKYRTSIDTMPLDFYVPFQQSPTSSVTILVRSAADAQMISHVRALIASLDPGLPRVTPQLLDAEQTGPVETQLRIATAVAASVGLVGLVLAAIGIYGVTAYVVSQRTREIGIRLAMGAHRGTIVGMVLRQGMTLVGIGSIIGLVLGLASGRVLAASPLGVVPLDPAVFAAAAILFAIVGLAACYHPARRAVRVDPISLLRAE